MVFRRLLTSLGVLTARPIAFAVVGVYAAAWFAVDRNSLDMHGIATLATWLMTLVIQRAEHRDTQAIHAKLDELVRSQNAARDEVMQLDAREPEEIEKARGR